MFGIPCPEIDPVLASLDPLGVRWVPVRHETAAVHMAEGVYKTTGKVSAVLANPGPGSANLLPGVITALHEGVSGVRRHRAAAPRSDLSVAARDVPLPRRSAPALPRRREVGRAGVRAPSARRGGAHGGARDVGRAAGTGPARDPGGVLYETASDAPAPSAARPTSPCLPPARRGAARAGGGPPRPSAASADRRRGAASTAPAPTTLCSSWSRSSIAGGGHDDGPLGGAAR